MKASALMFGRLLAEPPTPSAIKLNVIEENMKTAASIFFIDF
jgi:hypothetical protein